LYMYLGNLFEFISYSLYWQLQIIPVGKLNCNVKGSRMAG